MKKTRLFACGAGTAALTLSLGVGLAPGPASAAASIKNGGILHISMPWPAIDDNFNPLDPATSAATAGGTGSALYEPLMYVNNDTGRIDYMLATGYAWSNGAKTLTVTTRQGVDWNDGKPFSASDVAFTFNLLKKFPALDRNSLFRGQNLTSVTATNADTVVFQFSSPYTSAFEGLVETLIVPQHIWSKVANPVTFTNASHPVGTGPFELSSYSATKVVYKKNPNYWAPGEPHLSGLTMTAAKSNDAAELMVLKGSASETYVPITDPAMTFLAAHSWDNYWWPVTGLNLLYMNDAVAPFNNADLRRAIADALNTTDITDRAYYGAIPAANKADIPNGQVSAWFSPALKSLEWSYNPQAALSLLESHGYKLVDAQLRGPNGAVLPTFNILVEQGWADYLSMAQTIKQELSAIGINTAIDEEPPSTYGPELQDGTYDLAISWSNGVGPSPYYLYYYLLSSSETAPTGSAASTNWERYDPATIERALAAYNTTSSLTAQKADMATIEKNLLANVPVVPLTGRPNFLDYSTHYFTGWPSASNPYDDGEPPDDFTGGAEQLFLNVHLK